jgi:hypothetical protein
MSPDNELKMFYDRTYFPLTDINDNNIHEDHSEPKLDPKPPATIVVIKTQKGHNVSSRWQSKGKEYGEKHIPCL